MAIEARPVDLLTKANVFIGMPFVEFSPALTGGGYDSYRQLGIVETAALEKAIETIQLIDSRSGVQVTDREEVSSLDITMQLAMFKFDPDNLRLFLGSADQTTVSSATVAIVNERVTVLASDRFAPLQRGRIISVTGLNSAAIVNENVGTGQGGTFGEVQGTFELDWAVKVIGDVTSITVAGIARPTVAGAAPAAGQIGVIVGASATSGELTFPVGEAPALGAAIVANYTPSFLFADFILNTDYTLDNYQGGIRFLLNTRFRAGQPIDVDYSYTNITRVDLRPFTQLTFAGRARIKQLTDLGINFIWEVPSVQIRITDDDFAWSADGFATGNLALRILNAGGTQPFGLWSTYPETPVSP
jgi:hypothetical protein